MKWLLMAVDASLSSDGWPISMEIDNSLCASETDLDEMTVTELSIEN